MEFPEKMRTLTRTQSKPMSVFQTKVPVLTKRMIDVIASLTLIILLAPLLILISYLIYKKEGRPIFKQQFMLGKNQRLFPMWTYRIKTNPSKVIRSLPLTRTPKRFVRESQQLIQLYTSTGLWLKKFNFHKLPILYNVLKGDMSLVGPK